MPLIEHIIYPDTSELGTWSLDESESYFLSRLPLSNEEEEELGGITHELRRRQWLAVRYLVHKMSGRVSRGYVLKNTAGAPLILDSPFRISLSHSESYVAAAAAPYRIGVDIQVKTDKLQKILHRFMNTEELRLSTESSNLNLAHILWSAKECMFKAYGEGEIDFSEHLAIVNPADIDSEQPKGYVKAVLNKEGSEMNFGVEFQQDDQILWVVAKEMV